MRILIPFLIFLLLAASCSQQSDSTIVQSQIEEKIRDYADILNTNQEENIFGLISSFEQEAGSPISIITVDSLLGENIHSFAERKANELHANRDSRILITVVVQNKEVFIYTGEGLQHIVKEEITNQIIKEDIAPRFRKNRYGSGLFIAVSKMKKIFQENKESDIELHTIRANDNAVIAGR